MKKILFMIINMNIGGTEKALLNMIADMQKDKFDITILMLEEYGGLLESIPKHIHIEYLSYYDEIKELINNAPQKISIELIKRGQFIKGLNILRFHLLSKIKEGRSDFYNYILKDYPKIEEKYDLAVAYAGPMDFISYFILNKIKAKKKVQWVHFDVEKISLNNNFIANNYIKFDKIFIVSNKGKEKFLKKYPYLKDKTDTFFNVISSDLIYSQSIYGDSFSDKFQGKRILTVGRLTNEKGQDLGIKALKKLKDDGYDVRWYCVGDGSCRETYEKVVRENNLQKDFIFLGPKINPYNYMKNCDIYVQPSRHEGYCITLGEAKSFENPIVTTNFTGASEQIINRFNGLVCDISEEDIYKSIKELLDNDTLYRFISKNLKKDSRNFNNDISKLYNLF